MSRVIRVRPPASSQLRWRGTQATAAIDGTMRTNQCFSRGRGRSSGTTLASTPMARSSARAQSHAAARATASPSSDACRKANPVAPKTATACAKTLTKSRRASVLRVGQSVSTRAPMSTRMKAISAGRGESGGSDNRGIVLTAVAWNTHRFGMASWSSIPISASETRVWAMSMEMANWPNETIASRHNAGRGRNCSSKSAYTAMSRATVCSTSGRWLSRAER